MGQAEMREQLLRDTFDTDARHAYRPLWDFLDSVIDQGAKCEGILGGTECCFDTVEDFCKEYGIAEIPPLYADIFDARPGFLTQAKTVYYMRKEWNARFPEEHDVQPCASDPVLVKYKLYLESQSADPYVAHALEMFNWYLGCDSDDDDGDFPRPP